MTKNSSKVAFPAKFLVPIGHFLENEIKKLKKTQDSIEEGDPFTDTDRASQNSLEEDVDEQVGHLHSEVKVKFLVRQIVQIRKALARIKLGKYGLCESCGKIIDTDRLAIKPDATICVKCEKDKE